MPAFCLSIRMHTDRSAVATSPRAPDVVTISLFSVNLALTPGAALALVRWYASLTNLLLNLPYSRSAPLTPRVSMPCCGEPVGRTLAEHLDVDMVTFTGSSAVGS